MKTKQLNRTLEGTRSGDVVGGFTVTGRKPSGVLFLKGGEWICAVLAENGDHPEIFQNIKGEMLQKSGD
jgi:hypothetical protein